MELDVLLEACRESRRLHRVAAATAIVAIAGEVASVAAIWVSPQAWILLMSVSVVLVAHALRTRRAAADALLLTRGPSARIDPDETRAAVVRAGRRR